MKYNTLNMAVMLAIAGVGLSTSASAQREISGQIEEVVVTAQHREQNLQDVPVAVTALDESAIEKIFARDLTDVTGKTPNLVLTPILGNGTAAISIRGMQLNDVEKSFDPAVAVYQDGVYLQTTTGALLNVWDAERIEVLRGPQGTLFGRNTIGGLIHVIRSKPTGELGGKFSYTVAEDSQSDFKGTLNLPEFANISTKATYMNLSGGGYFDNATRGESQGETDMRMWSVSALWQPTDNFSLQLTYDDVQDDTPTRPVTCLTEAPEFLAPPLSPANECPAFTDDDAHRVTYSAMDQPASIELESFTATAEWRINDAHKATLIYGTRDMEETAIQEFDAVSSDLFWTSRPQFEEQMSVELRLESDFDRFRTTLGAFMWDSEYNLWQNSYFFGGLFASPWTKQETENTSVFGQVDFDLTDTLTLTLGGRYTKDEKEFCQVFTAAPGEGQSAVVTDYDGIGKVPLFGHGTAGICPSWSDGVINNNFVNPVTGQDDVFNGSQSWSEFTPKVGLTYNLDNGILYASYTEGFRSGGYNGRASAPGNAGPYEPENVESIEFGFKTSWLDNTVQFNGSFFSTDYEQKQEDVVLPDPVAITLTLVQNAAGATMEGAEFELVWMPTAGLSLNAALGYLDASYDDYTTLDPVGNSVDKSGFDLRRAPELNYSVGANWEIEVADVGFVVANVNYRWLDNYQIQSNAGGPKHYRSDPTKQEAFGLLDASINFETEHWRVSLFGKNLTDESYWYHTLDVSAAYAATSATDPSPNYVPGLWTFGTINRPRYFGAEVQYRF